jgi:hypothetical protein
MSSISFFWLRIVRYRSFNSDSALLMLNYTKNTYLQAIEFVVLAFDFP